MKSQNKFIMVMNIDSKPSFKRIPKGAIIEVVSYMINNYAMIKYEDGYYPVPQNSFKEV